MGYLTNFYRDSHQKALKKWRRKVQSSTQIQTADRPEIELKVACDVLKSVEFVKIYGIYDVSRNFELDFRVIGWLYLGAAFDFSSSFFELFLLRHFLTLSVGYLDKNWSSTPLSKEARCHKLL